jgi:hypothetical protein
MARHRNEHKVELLHNRYSRTDLEKKLAAMPPVERRNPVILPLPAH